MRIASVGQLTTVVGRARVVSLRAQATLLCVADVLLTSVLQCVRLDGLLRGDRYRQHPPLWHHPVHRRRETPARRPTGAPKPKPPMQRRLVPGDRSGGPGSHRFLFFFFQAEDGIRDGTVTGVQTCALPIWTASPQDGSPSAPPSGALGQPLRSVSSGRSEIWRWRGPSRGSGQAETSLSSLPRSEERRVGKECRSRWSPYH